MLGPRRPRLRGPFAGCGCPAPARPCDAQPQAECRTGLAHLARPTSAPPPRSSSDRRLCAAAAPDRRGGCSGNARHSTPTAPVDSAVRQATRAPRDRPPDDERQPPQLAAEQVVDHGRPGGVELARRSRSASTGDAVGLLDERDADPFRARDPGHRHEVRCGHASTGSVTEDQRGPWPIGDMQVGVRLAMRGVDFHHRHAGNGGSPAVRCRRAESGYAGR